MKDSGWRFGKINSMTIYVYKTTAMNGLIYVKIPRRNSFLLNFEIVDKYCFLRSILSCPHPCKNSHPNRVSNYRQKTLINQTFKVLILLVGLNAMMFIILKY